jgi:hypothetical protein
MTRLLLAASEADAARYSTPAGTISAWPGAWAWILHTKHSEVVATDALTQHPAWEFIAAQAERLIG